MIVVRTGLSLLFIMFATGAFANDCEQRMDSINYYVKTFPRKALVKADSLIDLLNNRACGVDSIRADYYSKLGLAYWELRDFNRADYAYRTSLDLFQLSRDSLNVSLLPVYLNYSGLNQEYGRFAAAERYLDLMTAIVEGNFGYNSYENVQALYRTGIHHINKGNYLSGLVEFREAYRIASTALSENDSLQARLLIEIGTSERLLGNYTRSQSELQAAINHIKDRNGPLYRQAIDRLSSLRIELGEFGASENDLLENLQTKYRDHPEDTLSIIETLNNLAVLNYKLNNLPVSKKYFSDAIALSGPYEVVKGTLINNLGTIYWREGGLDQAEQYFEEGGEIFRDVYGPLHPDYASSLSNLASVYNAQGNYEKAFNTYMNVLDLDETLLGDNHPQFATTLNNIALISIKSGQPFLADELLKEALKIRQYRLGTEHPLYSKTLNDLGTFNMSIEQPDSALPYFDRALELQIKHMKDILPVLTNSQREQFFEDIKFNIERFSSLAFNSSNQSKWRERALNYNINTKSILFYASDKMRNAILNSGDPELIQLYNLWRDLKFQLAQVILLDISQREKQGLTVQELIRESEGIERELGRAFKTFADQNDPGFHSWQRIRSALPGSTALVEVFQFRDYKLTFDSTGITQGFEDRVNYAAFIIQPDADLKIVRWDKEAEIERNHEYYRNTLKFAVTDTLSYKTYWKSIDEELSGVNRVLYAPDGIFHKMNPAIFYDLEKGEYVADKYKIINITSAKDLLKPSEGFLNQNAVIFGNPDYSTLPYNISLDQLPEAEREAEDIANILGGVKWQIESNYFSDATEKKIKESVNPGVLHIATHGYFESLYGQDNPLFSSGLYLSRSELTAGEDGILSAYEAMNLSLDETDLVVLSACETGLGEVKNGEGVFGLQRAFLVAGANHLIISLVKVRDDATRTFMKLFYQNLVEATTIEDAFFMARREFRKVDTNPYNWGAFIFLSN